MAPYATDIDLTFEGTVRATDFDTYSNSSYDMARVSYFIQYKTGTEFYGTKMMVAEWNNVPRDHQSSVS